MCSQSNYLPPPSDIALNTRLVMHNFDAQEEPPEETFEFTEQRDANSELLTALSPDWATFLHNGKLDRAAITDLETFIKKVIGTGRRSRSPRSYAIVTYYHALLNRVFMAHERYTDGMLEHTFIGVNKAMQEGQTQQNPLEGFILQIHHYQQTVTAPNGREEYTIFWHNFRSTETFHSRTGTQSAPHFAFYLEHVLNVFEKKNMKTFDIKELWKAADMVSWAGKGSAYFYDPRNGWPIANDVVEPETGHLRRVLLKEDELDVHKLMHRTGVLFIDQLHFQTTVANFERGVSLDVDFKTIEIESAFDGSIYNIYDSLVQGVWFGYRALRESTFASFCGFTNQLDMHNFNDVSDLQYNTNNAETLHYYDPRNLKQFYDFSFNTFELPPSLKFCPFVARNRPGDELMDPYKPKWMIQYKYKDPGAEFGPPDWSHEDLSTSESNIDVDVDEQSNVSGGPTNSQVLSSSVLADISGAKNSPSGSTKRKLQVCALPFPVPPHTMGAKGPLLFCRSARCRRSRASSVLTKTRMRTHLKLVFANTSFSRTLASTARTPPAPRCSAAAAPRKPDHQCSASRP